MVESAVKTKVVEKKKDLRSFLDSEGLTEAYASGNATKIKDIDLSFNSITNPGGLDLFPNIKSLLLDHNNISSLKDFPICVELVTLSLSFNKIDNLEQTLMCVSDKFPSLKHLNLMKNPINPMFNKDTSKYEKFRCIIKVWMPFL